MPSIRTYLIACPVVRAGIKAYLCAEPEMDVVGEALNEALALDEIAGSEANVLILDVSTPGTDGAQATSRIKQLRPDLRILAMAASHDLANAWAALEAGASGLISQYVTGEELVRAVQVVASGGTYLDPEAVGQLQPEPAGTGPGSRRQQSANITEREASVLQLLALGYATKEVASKLSVSVKTVETHKARAMAKLDLASRVDLVQYALQVGWLK